MNRLLIEHSPPCIIPVPRICFYNFLAHPIKHPSPSFSHPPIISSISAASTQPLFLHGLLSGFESLKSLIYINVRPTPYFFGGPGVAGGVLKNLLGPLGEGEKIFLLLQHLLLFFISSLAINKYNHITQALPVLLIILCGFWFA